MSIICTAVMLPINMITSSHNRKVTLNVTCFKEEDAKPHSWPDFINDSQRKIA